MESHYAPQTPLIISRLDTAVKTYLKPRGCAGQERLVFSFGRESGRGIEFIEYLSRRQDLREAAANLYGAMRRLDEAGLDLIVAEAVPETGLGVAIMERLRKAAARE